MMTLRFELDRVRQEVGSMLADHNNELNDLIQQQIAEQLNEDWIISEIKESVRKAIQDSLKEVANSYRIQRAITDVIEEKVVELIVGDDGRQP